MAGLRLYLAAGAVAALTAGAAWLDHRAYWRGYEAHAAEVAAETRETQRRLHAAADRASRLAAELAAQQAERERIDRDARDAIADHPTADEPGFAPGIMRELNRHR